MKTTCYFFISCANNCISTNQDGKFATQQLRAEGLLVGVYIDDTLFDPGILVKTQDGQRRVTIILVINFLQQSF